MPRRLPAARELRILEAKKSMIQLWAEGVQLESVAATPINQLCLRGAVRRWRLAQQFLKEATLCTKSKPAAHRSAISRYYYSLYHAFRAVTFISYGGDDHQEHKSLPTNLPEDFPDFARWSNRLKDARELRNEADYEPLPISEAHWKAKADSLHVDAKLAIAETRNYLRMKGCPV